MARKRRSAGLAIGGIIAGIEQQVFRTTPPANELVAKGTPLRPVAASGGGTLSIELPVDSHPGSGPSSNAGDDTGRLVLAADAVRAEVDLAAGGRVASFAVAGRELLVTEGFGPIGWGSFPMVPFAGRVRDGRFTFRGRRYRLPIQMPPHAIHGTVLDRAWSLVDERTIATELGPTWPFSGRAIQRFDLAPGRFTVSLELHADEPMPASIGWHPWFRRCPPPVDDSGPTGGGEGTGSRGEPGSLELDLRAGAMYRRDASGIATSDLVVPPPPGPWDDCFTDLREPPVLRWPGFLELSIVSDCPAWVVYTEPADALCVEPQTAPPDALNGDPAIVEPGRPLIAEMTWSWRPLSSPG